LTDRTRFSKLSSVVLIALPLLMPLVGALGMDPVRFAAIIATNLGMGLITPPTAPILYWSIDRQDQVERHAQAHHGVSAVGRSPVVLLTTFVPEFSLWLPNLVLGR
jgi:TRAP-type C4-dicarboxylate transport system permease large subunit